MLPQPTQRLPGQQAVHPILSGVAPAGSHVTVMSSMSACLMCRRMGLPTEGLPTTEELRAQEDSALQQALAESVAAAGPVIAQTSAGPSSGPGSVLEAAPVTVAAPEPEAAPIMTDEPAAGVLAAPAAAPTDAETVPPQLGGTEPAKRAKVRSCGSICEPCMAFCGRQICCSACSKGFLVFSPLYV